MHDSPPTQSLAVQAVQTRRLRTPLVREVRHFFLRHPIPGGTLLLACSGGPDSTALLLSCWLLQRALNLTLHVAVVDHGLRSAGKTEAQQVAALALHLGIPAHILSVTIEPGASLQAQARQARLAALHQCAQDHGLTHVAFGHTLEDQSETMLMRWLGGAGLAGLSGIAAVQRLPHANTQKPTDLYALRPLLRVSHDQIHAFLQPLSGLLCGLPVLDPSNQDPRFLRVRLRTEILPPLRALSPRLDQHLSELSQQLREDHAYLAQETQRVLAALVSQGGVVDQVGPPRQITLRADLLAAQPRALFLRLLQSLVPLPLSARHLAALAGLCTQCTGTQWLDLPGGWRAERCMRMLTLTQLSVPSPSHA